MSNLEIEIYTYKLCIDFTNYIIDFNSDFDSDDIINTFCSVVGYPIQSFHSIEYNKNDNRLWIEVYYKSQVDNILKEFENLTTEYFNLELQNMIEKTDIPMF